jgi:peptidoglycan/LPS O-acetylase OafA/YrhL
MDQPKPPSGYATGHAKDRTFRPDIDGLRAIAIVLVVAYHAEVPWLRAGFIGVDVFFVISGFLITRLLIQESLAAGKIKLLAFWGRRIRRLLPLAALVLMATSIACSIIGPRLSLLSVAQETIAAALYSSNLFFVFRARNYFNPSGAWSPLTHTWTLCVEEQFYLFWPVMVHVLARASRGRSEASRIAWLRTGFLALAAASFGFVIWKGASTVSFFGLHARAWQFAVGGLVACHEAARKRTAWWGDASALLGALALAIGLAVIDERTTFPGWATLLPTLGAAGIILGGLEAPASVTSRLLALAPLQAVGRLSYAWYLWHWPVLALVSERSTAPWALGTAVLLSFLLAVASHQFIEDRVRFLPALTKHLGRTYALGLGLTLLAATSAVFPFLAGRAALRDPTLQSVLAARSDLPAIAMVDCKRGDATALNQRCSFGAPDGPLHMVLIGDSHAHQWTTVFDSAGKQRGFRGVLYGVSNCPAALVEVARTSEREAVYRDCQTWHHELIDNLRRLGPQIVVATSSSAYPALGWLLDDHHPVADVRATAAWERGIGALGQAVRSAGMQFAYILDGPRLPDRFASCVEHTRDFGACSVARTDALSFNLAARAAEQRALAQVDGVVFDPLSIFCDDVRCPLTAAGVVVYRDTNHFTASFARHLGASPPASLQAFLTATAQKSK